MLKEMAALFLGTEASIEVHFCL